MFIYIYAPGRTEDWGLERRDKEPIGFIQFIFITFLYDPSRNEIIPWSFPHCKVSTWIMFEPRVSPLKNPLKNFSFLFSKLQGAKIWPNLHLHQTDRLLTWNQIILVRKYSWIYKMGRRWIKGSVSVISSEYPCKEDNARFTTVPFK